MVELVVAGDQHRPGAAVRPSGPSDLLAHRRQRSREAVQHHGVERPDVDAEFDRARGDDTAELTAREL